MECVIRDFLFLICYCSKLSLSILSLLSQGVGISPFLFLFSHSMAGGASASVDVPLTIIVLQLSDESGVVSVISSFCSTFLAAALSLLVELRHSLVKCSDFPHERHFACPV